MGAIVGYLPARLSAQKRGEMVQILVEIVGGSAIPIGIDTDQAPSAISVLRTAGLECHGSGEDP